MLITHYLIDTFFLKQLRTYCIFSFVNIKNWTYKHSTEWLFWNEKKDDDGGDEIINTDLVIPLCQALF